MASVKRNLGHLKWKLRKVDSAIKETLTCVLARSILVYIGTPMVAAGLWKREDIDRTEAQLFRQINGLPNIISNKAIMNVACSMRNAWEIVEPLALRANLQSRRQKQLKPERRETLEGQPREGRREQGVEQSDTSSRLQPQPPIF